MKRGEIWTAAGDKLYLSKPRPVVIIQDDRFHTEISVTVCAFTSDQTKAGLFRPSFVPSAENGLITPSVLMVDKISTVPRHKLRRRVGRLQDQEMLEINQAIMLFLGLVGRRKP